MCRFHTGLILAGQAGAYPSGLHFKGRLLALSGIKVANTLAFYGRELMTIVKSFVVQPPEKSIFGTWGSLACTPIKLFVVHNKLECLSMARVSRLVI